MVQTLVGRGARVGVCNGLNQNALHVACFQGHADIAQVLLRTQGLPPGANGVDAMDVNGHSALILASLRGHRGVMRVLLDAGADGGLGV